MAHSFMTGGSKKEAGFSSKPCGIAMYCRAQWQLTQGTHLPWADDTSDYGVSKFMTMDRDNCRKAHMLHVPAVSHGSREGFHLPQAFQPRQMHRGIMGIKTCLQETC